jgi:hypothetical protein
MCRAITNAYTHSESNSDTKASSYTSTETVEISPERAYEN